MAAGYDYSSGLPITSKIPSLLTEKPQPPVRSTPQAVPQTVAQATPESVAQAVAQSMASQATNLAKPKPKSHETIVTPSRNDGALVPAAVKTTPTGPLSGIAPIKSRMLRGDHHLLATSEESVMVKQIQKYHSPDGFELEYDSKYVLNIIEEIILRVSTIIPGIEERHRVQERLEELERESVGGGFTDLRDDLAYPINKISSELICKVHLGGDGRKVTEELFQSLANFSWEAKVVIAFGAFAIQYGEFWLVAQLYRTNPLARSVGLLMEVSDIIGSSETLRNKFRAITDLVNAMLDVAKLLFEFKEMLARHPISHDTEEKIEADAHFPVAAYWTVRSIVACTSIFMNLMAMGHEYMSTAMEAWEVDSLAHKLAQIKDHLQEQKHKYWLKLEEKRQYDAYLAIKRLFEVPHLDNMKILKALIYAKDDQLPLYDGALKTKTSLEVLKRKSVVLLVSELDIPPQEFDMLLQLHSESKDPAISYGDKFEMVWLPIIGRSTPLTDEILRKFYQVQATMPWYSVVHPAMIEPAVIKFMREDLKFEHKPILVVLDPQGQKKNDNAINMYWIWGGQAFPFTAMREEELWLRAEWNMELLVDSIDQSVVNWLQTDKLICVFGGGDIDWIRRFTTTAKSIAKQLQIPLELLYVGKATSKERIKRNNEIIQRENLSTVLHEYNMGFFWTRLNCMWNSRDKPGKPVELDDKLSRILEILTYDNSDVEWAVFGKGNSIATKRGDIFIEVLDDFPTWGPTVSETRYFVPILNDLLRDRHPEFHCSRLFYPGTAGRAPHKVSCPECGKSMEKHLMYRCCRD